MERNRFDISRLLKWIAIPVVALVPLACGGGKAAEETTVEQAKLILAENDVYTAQVGSLTTGITVTGTLEPYRVVDVMAQVSGTISGVSVDRGRKVGAGTLLANIRAEGVRNAASSAQAAVGAAEANLRLAQANLESARALHQAGAMSDLDFRGAQTQFEAAQSQVAAARAQAVGLNEQARYTRVTSPISGTVSDRLVESGEAVNPGQKLFTVVNTDQLELAGNINAADVSRVRVGQAVVFTLDGYGEQTFRGTVARIEPTADPVTRQIGVYLRLNNPGDIVGGLFATGRILAEEVKDVLLVPATAVQTRGDQKFVMTVENGKIARRTVETGASDPAAGLIAITSGLQSGARVVLVQSAQITEGAAVETARPGATKPATATPAKPATGARQ